MMAQKQKSQAKSDSFIPSEFLSTDFFQEHANAPVHTKALSKNTESALSPEHEQAITESLDRVLRRFESAHGAQTPQFSRATQKAAAVLEHKD